MSRHASDTSAYSHLVRGNKAVANLLNAATVVVMPQPAIVELRCGFGGGPL